MTNVLFVDIGKSIEQLVKYGANLALRKVSEFEQIGMLVVIHDQVAETFAFL